MSELEEKLGAILSNPQMMRQISEMAQAMNAQEGQRPAQNPAPPPNPAQNPGQDPGPGANLPELPSLDPRLLGSLAGILRGSGIDSNEQTLLRALGPYLSQRRVRKLEKAMRAAKMAGLASGFLSSGGLQMLSGR